jgi:ABC-type multidrug transport system permease subunit
MKAVLVAWKSLIEISREIQLLALTVGLPLVFLMITVATYNTDLLTTHSVWIINDSTQGTAMIAALETQRYADGDPVFEIITTADRQSADRTLSEGEITALMRFSDDPSSEMTQVTIYGDALSNKFYRASTILENTLLMYGNRLAGRSSVIEVTEHPLVTSGPKSEFDLYAPGMINFGLLMIIPQTAMLMGREVRWKTLGRLRLTRLRAWDLLGGISLAQFVVAVAQVVIVLLAAVAMGFNNQGSLGLAILVGLAVSASAIGQGLLVACFVEDDSQAANVGSTFAMIQVFLSGSFYQLPPLTVFTLAGHQIDVFDIFPATHGFRALQQVLTYGDGFQQISFRLGATAILSLVYIGISVIVFQRLKMKG